MKLFENTYGSYDAAMKKETEGGTLSPGGFLSAWLQECEMKMNGRRTIMFEKISLSGISNEDWLRLRKTGIGGSDAGRSAA